MWGGLLHAWHPCVMCVCVSVYFSLSGVFVAVATRRSL